MHCLRRFVWMRAQREKELSMFYAPTGNKSASSHIYKLCLASLFLHQSGQRPCVHVCVTEYQSVNRQQLLRSEGMTRCLRGDKDRQAWRKEKEGCIEGWERPCISTYTLPNPKISLKRVHSVPEMWSLAVLGSLVVFFCSNRLIGSRG